MMERIRDVRNDPNVLPATPSIQSGEKANASLHGLKQQLLVGENGTRIRLNPSRRRRRSHNDYMAGSRNNNSLASIIPT
jgi:hypothetical protein